MRGAVAGNQRRRAAAGAVLAQRVLGGPNHARVVGEAQIVVRGEVDVSTAVYFDVRGVERLDDAALAEQVLLAQAGQVLLRGLLPVLAAHSRRRRPAGRRAATGIAYDALPCCWPAGLLPLEPVPSPGASSSASAAASAISAMSPASSSIAAPVKSPSRCFISRPTLNLTVRFSGTATGSNVFGFWALRALRSLVSKTPKSRNSSRLPRPSSLTI